ncbi:MAG: HAD-IIIA family hydrolase [Alphaproteobacteria bacterium]
MRRAVFLDRDGTINRAIVRDGRPYPPPDLAALEILPGAADAVRRLHTAGFLTVIVTNQPDVARGLQSRATVAAIHAAIRAAMPITAIRACYAEEGKDGGRYKPAPGMLLEAAASFGIALADSFMVGDRWRDVGAGAAAGCFTILIESDYTEPVRCRPDAVVASLAAAADLILAGRPPDRSAQGS